MAAGADAGSGAAGQAAFPKSPDVSREVMGWMVFADGARVLRELVPGGENADLKALQTQTAVSMGVDPVLGQILDLKKPAAIGVLNPMLLSNKGVRPFVAMLPTIGAAQVEKVLQQRGAQVERKPWGFAVDSAQGKLYVGFQRALGTDYAVVAWRPDLLDAAQRLLAPRLSAKADAPILVHVSMDNLYIAFGPQLDAMLTHFGRLASNGGPNADPQVAYAMRGVKQMLRFADSVSSMELLLNLDSGGLTVTARLDGKPNGAWTAHVQQQQTGPAWGVQYLPRDAVLVYTTHSNAEGRAIDIGAQLAYFAGASPTKRPNEKDLERWHRALSKAASTTGGELAYAVWPGRAGGVGVGGAYKLADPGMAREAIMGVYSEVSSQLGGMVARALSLDPDKLASKFTVKHRNQQVADAEVDIVELTPSWPKTSAGEKRLFEALFGPKLVLATAFVGDQALFTLGRDWEARLETMLKTAQGERGASLGDEPDFAEALQYHRGGRVSMSYLETGRMARFAAGLLAQANDLDAQQRAAVDAILAQVGRGAIVTTTNASGRRYELTSHVPRSAIMGAARLNGALWRVALSPLVNPPMMPPMPVPPPHVAPSLNQPSSQGEGPTM